MQVCLLTQASVCCSLQPKVSASFVTVSILAKRRLLVCAASGTNSMFAPAECLGVGLVRAVDADAGLLYVLSPLLLSSLQRVNLLQVRRLWIARICHRLHVSSS